MNEQRRMTAVRFLWPAFAALLIAAWVWSLQGTDAYPVVYWLCAAAGLVGLWYTALIRPVADKGRRLMTVIFAVLFTAAVFLSNYTLFFPLSAHLPAAVFNLAGSFATGYGFFDAFCVRAAALQNGCAASAKRRRPGRVFWLSAALIAGVDLVYLFFAAYPGYITSDSLWQLQQVAENVYSNHHPFWHTIFIKFWTVLGDALFHNANAAVCLYTVSQVLFMAGCFSFAVTTLYEAGIPKKWVGLTLAVFAFLPLHITYSVTMWKDVVFGGAVLVFVTAAYRLLHRVGKSRALNYALFTAGCLGFGLWRSNGWLAMLVTFVVFALTLRKKEKKMLVTMAVLLVVTFVLKHPVLNALHVTQPDFVEACSIPVQQVARVVADGCELTPEQTASLSKIVDLKRVALLYQHEISDRIKGEIRRVDQPYLVSHKGEYLSLWLQLGLRYPDEYLKAWVDETRGYWNGGYEYWIYSTELFENDLGLSATVRSPALAAVFSGWCDIYVKSPVTQPVRAVGLHVWLTAAFLLAGLVNRKKEFLLAVPGIALVLTLLVSTPVFCEFRYAYVIFTIFPFLGFVTLYGCPAEKPDAVGRTAAAREEEATVGAQEKG